MKKISDKGLLAIQIDSNNKMKVVFNPIDGTVWMDRNELCRLFGCYMKDIDRSLGDIFEKKMFRVEDTCKYHIVASGRRVSYDITAINLTVIITMAFYLATPEAKTLRMWFVEQFTNMKCLDIPILDFGQNFLLN